MTYIVDVEGDHLADMVFVRFLHCKSYCFLLLFILCSLNEKHYVQPTLKERGVVLHLFEGGAYLHKLLEILLHGIYISFPTPIYLFV